MTSDPASSDNGAPFGRSSDSSSDLGRYYPGSGGHSTSLQTRADFLKNWNWLAITSINRSICARSGSAHGLSSESGKTCGEQWEAFRVKETSLLETLNFLRDCHKAAPFLNFNGNTFGSIGADLVSLLYGLDPYKPFQNVITSVAVHLIANKVSSEELDRELVRVESSLSLGVGDEVSYANGRKCGVITKILPDCRFEISPGRGLMSIIASPGTVLKARELIPAPRKRTGIRLG
jgi:hypothetical protein